MAESISEGTLRSWSKQVGDSVEADEEVATIETDKVSFSPFTLVLYARFCGVESIRSIYYTNLASHRLMSVLTRLQQERLWSFSQRRRILSPLAKNSSESSPVKVVVGLYNL